MEGHGIKSGMYIPDQLRQEINSACLVFLFISKSYKTSEICLNELGAAWATLEKEKIKLILLPDTDFDKIGFLDFNRIAIKSNDKSKMQGLIDDCKDELNPKFNLQKITSKLDEYLEELKDLFINTPEVEQTKKVDERTDCFENNLFALHNIILSAIPAQGDGVHKVETKETQHYIMNKLSEAAFLDSFWYKYAGGDFYVQKIKKQPTGNWLISIHNWEIKIEEMWVCKYSELQYEFVLIKIGKLTPFNIQSDIGGQSYSVGILNDGTVVSYDEYNSGYGIISGHRIRLGEYGVEPRIRESESHWVFLVSSYHKAGYNPNQTIEFCKKLDSEEVQVSQTSIMNFLRHLRNNPVVTRYR